MEPLFVFDDPPSVLVVYASLNAARQSVESLDVGENQESFTATGQVVRVTPTDDLFAALELTERRDLDRLIQLLRQAQGPAHLADDPAAYAEEWCRIDDEESRRPPLPRRRALAEPADKGC